MPAQPDIRVARVDATLAPCVATLQVAPSQRGYVGDVAFNLADSQRDPLSDAMAILADDTVVGFYRLDRAPRTVIGRVLDRPHLGLRAFLIGREYQGRGLALAAIRACCRDAHHRYPDHPWLALAVHCDNLPAVAAYRRAGFGDTGQLIRGGKAGLQHVMLYRLRDQPDPVPAHTSLRAPITPLATTP